MFTGRLLSLVELQVRGALLVPRSGSRDAPGSTAKYTLEETGEAAGS